MGSETLPLGAQSDTNDLVDGLHATTVPSPL